MTATSICCNLPATLLLNKRRLDIICNAPRSFREPLSSNGQFGTGHRVRSPSPVDFVQWCVGVSAGNTHPIGASCDTDTPFVVRPIATRVPAGRSTPVGAFLGIFTQEEQRKGGDRSTITRADVLHRIESRLCGLDPSACPCCR
jgi:hypothetical protein